MVIYLKREKLIKFRNGKSQKEMAKRYGVTQQIWSRWETGVRTPRIENMKRLEDDIGIPISLITSRLIEINYIGGVTMDPSVFTKITFNFGDIDEKIDKVLKKRQELENAVYDLRNAIETDGIRIEIKKSPNLPDTDEGKDFTI